MLEGEPPAASSRAADKTTARALRGDFDAILAKALKREPAQRYVTADAMAEDIERYLTGEPVLAQPDRIGYRLGKALRRHRVGFAAVAAVLLTVFAGVGASLVQAQRANESAERARAVRAFVVDVFKVNERGNPANNELRQLPAELLLERGAKLIETKFAGQPGLQAELYGVVGGIFADMGSAKLAADYATQQIEALTVDHASDADQARAMMLLADSLLMQGRYEAAEQQLDATPTVTKWSVLIRASISLERRDPRGALDRLKDFNSSNGRNGNTADLRGAALCQLGQTREGLLLFDDYILQRSPLVYEHDPDLARARALAALCALSAGERTRAIGYAALARRAFAGQPGVSPYFKAPLLQLEGKLARR